MNTLYPPFKVLAPRAEPIIAAVDNEEQGATR